MSSDSEFSARALIREAILTELRQQALDTGDYVDVEDNPNTPTTIIDGDFDVWRVADRVIATLVEVEIEEDYP